MSLKFNVRLLGEWVLVVATFSLLSPKWIFAPVAWIAPALMLAYLGKNRFWFGALSGWLAFIVSGIVSLQGVLPFPGVFFVVMTVFISLVKIIPYLVSNWLAKRLGTSWWTTLIFPCALVTSEYIDSFGGGGTWGSLAYTQSENFQLIQLASLGGIWCITFLIGWFSSLLNWMIAHRFEWQRIRNPAIGFMAVITLALFYGLVKTNSNDRGNEQVVRIAGITANNAVLMKTMYEDYFEKKIDVDPDKLTQSSPELQELQKGFVKFIEEPGHHRFAGTHNALETFQDSLLAVADREAKAGAKLITFSEGLFIMIKSDEKKLIEKAKNIAKSNSVYIALSVASLIPGEVEFGKKFVENKIVLINPEGSMENEFFKNKPVPVVEPSLQGDGDVPVIQTPLGNIALSICYDADFPSLMRKAGAGKADLMILPSGDWKEISPYHGRMAIMRSVENGFALVRMVSGATSVATDAQGRILAARDFNSEGERILVAYLPVQRIKTLYTVIGDSFALSCTAALLLFISLGIARQFKRRQIPNNVL